jgi:hypothetical protein
MRAPMTAAGRRRCLAALLSLPALAARPRPARAHELPGNRLTLVLRNGNHVALSFLIDYPDALHRTLAPDRPFAEFALAASTLPAAELAALLQRAHARLQADTRLTLPDDSMLAITGWQWPDAARARSLLQQRVMAAVVAPREHTHEPPVEIRADAMARQPLRGLSVRLPAPLQRVLVVWSRPEQQWLDPDGAPLRLRF